MESLIRQTRVRFSGVGQDNKEEASNIGDRRILPQKTQSFKEVKKKTQNWFRRQFSRQMREDYDFENGEVYPVAVAAVALVIKLLEEELGIKDQKKSEGLDTSLTKIKSKTKDTRIRGSELGETSMIDMEDPNRRVPSKIAVATEKRPEKAIGPVQSFKRTPTFVDKDRKPESALPTPDLSSAKRPTSLPTEIKRQPSTKPGIGETKADTWEKAQMAKLKEKYEKLNTTILEWEKKKKDKAKLQKDRTESELERRRAKALRQYRSDMERIDQIAGGARSQAGENKRNEEFKVKEKANKIRSTGKIPATCLCF
ncbi:hypothetical protein ACSBR2_039832 [Camellia fascicularis]